METTQMTGSDLVGITRMSQLVEAAAKEETVRINGAVHNVRDMSGFAFVVLRLPSGIVQCVLDDAVAAGMDEPVVDECCVSVTGKARKEERAPGGVEIVLERVQILSRPADVLPIAVNKWKMGMALDTELSLRPISLRNARERATYRIQSELVRGISDFLYQNGFMEVHTPKIVSASAEGGANVFRMDYFGKKAYLAQSPQVYKQTLVGVYERVFEIGPVFRAEKHNTSRHLNEYISVDFEMGYIRDFTDICAVETAMLRHAFAHLRETCPNELRAMKVDVPDISSIPMVRFDEAKEAVSKEYNRRIRNPFDLEPEEEVLIGRYFKEKHGSDFVFVTHYPTKKRPFYAMDDPADPRYTLSFDLLFRGMEVTTGGQRIHDYAEQVAKMDSLGMDPEDFASYLMIHKYGMPPHGGLGLGLERLCMKLFDAPNVRKVAMFPRDMHRLEP